MARTSQDRGWFAREYAHGFDGVHERLRKAGASVATRHETEDTGIRADVTSGARSNNTQPQLRILVVEDDADGARAMANLLRNDGHDTQVALNGPSALEDERHWHPDVVLLDLGLPGVDGYEVARQMRERSKERNPFFIAITGYGQEDDRRRSQEAGIDLRLVKPVDPEKLQNLLRRFARIVLPSE